ncbi:MAG: insulinase family protein, partial [Deltaproteobacteria bacterium]|nr:insulinase family protein [Deltaproteobacteria bacterium]
MQWLLVRTDGAPVFTGVVQVKVGGIEEAQGKTGLAHMFEHMAFKGTREIGTTDFAAEAEQLAAIRRLEARIAKATPEERQALEKELEGIAAEARKYAVSNELWRLFHKNGADELNAYTNKDLTGYYARLATNMLPLWAYLTAGMVGAPVLREFYQERSVVMEERRSSVDSNPHGKLYEALVGTAFDKSPYRWPTIGSMEDLRDLRLTDAESFYRNYYCPDRMVGVVAGGIDVGLARRAVTQSFGALPARRCLPLTPHESVEPPQSSPRKVIVPFRAEPRIMIAWHKPALPHRDDYVFDLLLPIFCDGTTSRLARRLVQTER